MKNYLNQLLIIATFIIVGCSDPCKDAVCGQGACDDGTCICSDGYEGTACEILENNKYFGLYNVTEIECSIVMIPLSSVDVAANEGVGPFKVTLTLTVGGDVIDFFNSTLENGKLNGSGSYNGLQILLTGVFTDVNTFTGTLDGGVFLICDFKMVK